MSMTMTAAPAAEPITLAEAKAHCRVDGSAEDAFISSLIVTSRLQIEAALGLALITQSWRLTLDAWPESGALELPMRPVQSVQAVEIAGPGSATTTLPASGYHLDGNAAPARVLLEATAFPMAEAIAEGIAIRFTAGFGDSASDVPQPIRHALLLLVAHWFENREPTSAGVPLAAIPETVSALLAPFRVVRL